MEVPYQKLDPQTLENIIVDFVTREGTDYGHVEIPIAKKVQEIKKALAEGRVVLNYDEESESCNIVGT